MVTSLRRDLPSKDTNGGEIFRSLPRGSWTTSTEARLAARLPHRHSNQLRARRMGDLNQLPLMPSPVKRFVRFRVRTEVVLPHITTNRTEGESEWMQSEAA